MYVTLRWEAIILLCENLQFGASLHLSLYGGWVGYGSGWVSYLVSWVWSGSMKWTHARTTLYGIQDAVTLARDAYILGLY